MALDEVPEHRLAVELMRRSTLRRQRKCDYCERPWNSQPVCKFPDRHQSPARREADNG